MEPTWGPSGADRTQVGPMMAHELCYLGSYRNGLWARVTGDNYQLFPEASVSSLAKSELAVQVDCERVNVCPTYENIHSRKPTQGSGPTHVAIQSHTDPCSILKAFIIEKTFIKGIFRPEFKKCDVFLPFIRRHQDDPFFAAHWQHRGGTDYGDCSYRARTMPLG